MTIAYGSSMIPPSEFARRRNAVVNAARARGFDALLICARGGGTLDRYADVMYLANYYTTFPFIPDVPPHWSARGHAFILLPTNDSPVLLADLPPSEEVSQNWDGDVVVASDLVDSLGSQLRARGLASGLLGIVGSDTLPWSILRTLQANCPGARWVPADEILRDLRAIKSAAEIAILTAAAEIGSRAIDAMLDAAVPGARYADIILAGLDVLIPAGAVLLNAFIDSGVGGLPVESGKPRSATQDPATPLAEGQWFDIGLSGVYKGYYFDLARSRAIGEPTSEQIATFEDAIACVEAAIAAIRPGATAGEVAEAGFRRRKELGYPTYGSFPGFGHGIGLGWDSPWLVPGDTTPLVPGMVLCIECHLRRQGYAGNFEETILVTEEGSRCLTTARVRRW